MRGGYREDDGHDELADEDGRLEGLRAGPGRAGGGRVGGGGVGEWAVVREAVRVGVGGSPWVPFLRSPEKERISREALQ